MQPGSELRNIFGYGTLKRGDNRHFALIHQQFLGEVATEPLYQLFILGRYPGLVDAKEERLGKSVRGELYAVTLACLKELDVIEGVVEGLYTRKHVQLQAPFNTLNVEAYFYLGDISRAIELGESWPIPSL